jgi:general stress protein YciG
MNVVEAGRKGGLTVLRKLGREFYVRIGQQGQIVMRQKYPNMASAWGKKGGRRKKPNLEEKMGENGK